MQPLVLLIDDLDANRFLRGRILGAAGFRVIEAATGYDGLRLATECRPSAILLDVRLPDISGFLVCKKLKADPATAGIPVLHISDLGRREHGYPEAFEHHSEGYLREPVEPADLVAIVKTLVRAGAAAGTVPAIDSVLEGREDALIRLDAEFRCRYLNAAARRLLPLGGGAWNGLPVWDVIGVPGAALGEHFQQVVQWGVPAAFEVFSERQDRWFRLAISELRTGGLGVAIRDITDLKRAERQLRQSSERLEMALKNAGAAFWDWDLATGHLDWPPELFELFGLDPASCPASFEAWESAIHPGDRSAARARVEKALADNSDLESEYRIILPDGGIRWVSAHGRTIHDDRGQPARMSGVCMDITGRKRAEEALRNSQERLRVAQRAARCGIWAWDLATHAVEWSDEMYELSGVDRSMAASEEVLFDWVHPDDRQPVRDAMEAAIAGKKQFRIEFRVVRVGGEAWVESIGDIVRRPDGEATRVTGIAIDVTERKQAEQTLRESEERLRLAVEATGLGTFDYFPETGRLVCSDAAVRSLGLAPGADYQAFLRGIHPEDRARVELIIGEALAAPDAGDHVAEFRAVDPAGGERWFALLGRALSGTQRHPERFVGMIRDITARKRRDREIERGREQILLAHRVAGIQTWEWDPVANRSNWPAEMSQLFGIEPGCEDPLARRFERVHPEDRHALSTAIRNAIATGSGEAEYKYARSPGETLWFRERLRLLASGTVLGVTLDITGLKQREEALRNSERIYRAIGESIDYGVWICTPDGRNIYVSESFLRLVGRTQQQCSDFGWGEVLHPDDSARTIAAWKECVRTGGVWDIEHRFRATDGRYHPVLARGVPVRDEKGEIICWAGINLDLTGLRQAEAELREAHRRLNLHIGISPLAIVEWTCDFRISRWAGEAERIFGWSEDEVLGKRIDELPWVYEPDLPLVEKAIADMLSGARPSHVTRNRNVRKNGAVIHCEWYNSSLLDASGKLVSVFCQVLDVTERKRAEETLARSNRELEQFAAVVSHDLRTPLRTISAFSELLSREYAGKLDGEANTYLGFIAGAVRRMRGLIDSMLEYARLDSERADPLEPVKLGDLVGVALLNLRAEVVAAGASISSDDLPVVNARSRQIEQVFQNLIGNAIRYRRQEPPRVHISSRRTGEGWVISVRDNGTGFDPAAAERIFRPLERLAAPVASEGYGMGLAICKRAVERHGGRIWAESEPGSGSTFYFFLPAAASGAQPAAAG